MDGATPKSELLRLVESQKDQINRYESRLKDIVRAYKGLQKEKDALETSLKAITNQSDHAEPAAEERKVCSEPDKEDLPQAIQGEGSKLKDQVATLTKALSTVTQEKSRIELTFQADKKRLLQEHEASTDLMKTEIKSMRIQLSELASENKSLKAKSRSLKHDLEREQSERAIQLKELQSIVSSERAQRERIEHEVEECREIRRSQSREQQQSIAQQYEKKMSDLRNELQRLENMLKQSEEKANRPSPYMLKLQQDFADLKAEHKAALASEHQKAVEAESRAKNVSRMSEERVTMLESKLSELSNVVGNYDKVRQQDQCAIQKLRDRVQQLDLENAALSRIMHSSPNDIIDNCTDLNVLVQQFHKLKNAIKEVNSKSEEPIDIDSILSPSNAEDVHRKCHEEVQQLKSEFERYKQKVRNRENSSSSKEVDILKKQLAELKNNLHIMHASVERLKEEHRKEVEKLTSNIKTLEEQHAQQVASVESEYQHRLGQVDLQMQRQRDRTRELVQEKDKTIEMLRRRRYNRRSSGEVDESATLGEVGEAAEGPPLRGGCDMALDVLPQCESQPLLHYTQELARRAVEIAQLRTAKHAVEAEIRELRQTSATETRNLVAQVNVLKQEVRQLDRYKSREAANLEYVKNIFLSFLRCDEPANKHTMLNAIATVLEFTREERQSLASSAPSTPSAWFKGQ